MNYEEMSDNEINEMVADLMGGTLAMCMAANRR